MWLNSEQVLNLEASEKLTPRDYLLSRVSKIETTKRVIAKAADTGGLNYIHIKTRSIRPWAAAGCSSVGPSAKFDIEISGGRTRLLRLY